MTLFMDYDLEFQVDFDAEKVASDVIIETLLRNQCPVDVTINLLLTGEDEIRVMNQDFRGIDRSTDVLSFPNIDFDAPCDFAMTKENSAAYMDPETKELLLGDIVICVPVLIAQAAEYEHSIQREFAFLVTHSVLHLIGYDHETEQERLEMERLQEEVLQSLKILRD